MWLCILLCHIAFQNNLDGVILRCPNLNCQHYQTVRKGSFFTNGKHSMLTQLKIMVCFVSDVTVSSASRLLGIRRSTVTEYYDNLRGEIVDNLKDYPITFSDNGEYEVDECLLKHVYNPRNRKNVIQWIGGIVERTTGKVVLKRISDLTAQTLIPWIQEHVPHGSFIYTDELRSYSTLKDKEYTHLSVNHSKHEYSRQEQFGTEILNVHINTLEALNREVRRRFANKSSRRMDRIDMVLAEIMYRYSGRPLFWAFKV